jgi:hypothetical protein
MACKEKKTAQELTDMIMHETRCHPEFFSNIIDVKVSPAQQGPSNWTAEFTFAATRSGPWPVCLEADELIRLFQADFELM